MRRSLGIITIPLIAFISDLPASVTVPPSQYGIVTRITDIESRMQDIDSFKVSRDGSTAVLLVDNLVIDDRGCGSTSVQSQVQYQQSLLKLDIETGDITVLEDGFTFGSTGICNSSLAFGFDVSDDGQFVAYGRRTPEATFEIVLVDGATSSVLVTELTETVSGAQQNRALVFAQGGGLDISGDGQWVVFGATFGPTGAGNATPQDFATFWRVNTTTGVTEKLLSKGDLDSMVLDPQPTRLLGSANPRIESSFDGSVVLLPVGDTNGFTQLFKVEPDSGTKTVVLNRPPERSLVTVTGPSLTPDGSRMAYSWATGFVEDVEGILIKDLDGISEPVQIDDGDYDPLPLHVHLSSDGSRTSQYMVVNGTSAYRTAATDGSRKDIATYPMTRVFGRGGPGYLNHDGTKLTFLGSMRTTNSPLPNGLDDIIVIELLDSAPSASDPSIDGLVASPYALMVKAPDTNPRVRHAHEYTVSSTETPIVNTFAYDPGTATQDAASLFWETTTFTSILDDGAWDNVDEVAGDGIYTEGSLFVREEFPGNTAVMRGTAITDQAGAFVDFELDLQPAAQFIQTLFITSSAATGIEFEGTGVTVDLPNLSGSSLMQVERIPSQPLEFPEAIGEHWRIHEAVPSATEAVIYVIFDGTLVAGNKSSNLSLYFSPTGKGPWQEIPSTHDPAANMVTAEYGGSPIGFWAIAPATMVQPQGTHWSIY